MVLGIEVYENGFVLRASLVVSGSLSSMYVCSACHRGSDFMVLQFPVLYFDFSSGTQTIFNVS